MFRFNNDEIERMIHALKCVIANPFIDDIEDFVVEAILEYSKSIEGIDPFFYTRAKLLFDVVDTNNNIGWSVKSLQWNIEHAENFELVIQRADVFKKSHELGFNDLNIDSEPNLIGNTLLRHWNSKIIKDATIQNVTDKRIFVLLKKNIKNQQSNNTCEYIPFQDSIKLYEENELEWKWTDAKKAGLKGFKNDTLIYRWYSSQKQLFEVFRLPENLQKISIPLIRFKKDEVVSFFEEFSRSCR